MTIWINFAIQLIFLYTFWVTAPQLNAYYGVMVMGDRNPNLLERRPDWQRSLHDTRWFLWPGYAAGALSVTILAAIKFGLWQPNGYGEAKALFGTVALSAVVGMAWWLVAFVVFLARWWPRLPLASRRQASLTIRHFDADVPRWAWVVAGALLVVNLAVQLALHLLGLLDRPRFWTGLGWQTLYFAVVACAATWSTHRRPNGLDRQYGPKFRRLETRLMALFLAALPLLNLLRIWRELDGVSLSDRYDNFAASLLIFSVVVLAIRLWGALNVPQTGGTATPNVRP